MSDLHDRDYSFAVRGQVEMFLMPRWPPTATLLANFQSTFTLFLDSIYRLKINNHVIFHGEEKSLV